MSVIYLQMVDGVCVFMCVCVCVCVYELHKSRTTPAEGPRVDCPARGGGRRGAFPAPPVAQLKGCFGRKAVVCE